ncbi:MAG: sorbosone dehydrogenase family protein [Phenylobacterium sp.]|uniref:PQQ-dependent sugar dehydrogenase n=1 Tax=Phenylobacterium sp. TaxID=1871053 RepID=UPI001A46F196|nr:sorbosone dehydrogenase family protein [Phenylobacterium sp.]MBL8774226.1 sorbosone dehydrogenase family protein [Phenylobacterium sp.]
MRRALTAAAAALAIAGCQSPGSSDPFVGFGPNPALPAAQKSLIPSIGAPDAVGWPEGAAPKAPPGFAVTRFGSGLDHPRWLYVLPNGDVLVAESAAPPKPPGQDEGIRGFFQKMLMKKVGSAVPSADRITLLRDADGDGVAETRTIFAQGLKSPFGMTLVGGTLYVANHDGVVSFPYRTGDTQVSGAGTPVFALPGPPINHHWTKNVVASPDGAKLYATVGSNSNIGENGMAAEAGRAAVWVYDIASAKAEVFATGLRNPNGIDFDPATGAMWTVVNERDEIGPDVPPDYLTTVQAGGFYGWPYSYWGVVDARVKPQNPERVARAIRPDYGLGAHTASLGLVFYRGEAFPAQYRGGAFIGQHGSWNRKPLSGYRVVFVPFAGGRPTMPPEVFLTGFLNADNKIQGRPVGVAVDGRGGLLVADDVGDIVWRVAPVAG